MVNQMNNEGIIDTEELRLGASEFGIELNEKQIAQFVRFAELLEEWNSKINLTRVPRSEIVSRHYIDSLSSVKAAAFSRGLRVVDVGTGAGFPGIPLKIAFPSIEVLLMDGTKKKLDFLKIVTEELELGGVTYLHSRAEDAGRDPKFRERFDVATSRAVARINVLAEYMLPLVRVGGVALMLKSDDLQEELVEGEKAIKTLGGSEAQVAEIEIPGTAIVRKIVRIAKTAAVSDRYPRVGGVILKRPL